MPDAPRSPRLPFDDIEEIAAATRRQGGRISAARRQLLEVLFTAEGPMSAESIARALAHRGTEIELSSIYRSLEALEQLGAVRHVHIGHGPGLYALTGRERARVPHLRALRTRHQPLTRPSSTPSAT